MLPPETGTSTYISPITAWEVGILAARERLKLLIAPQRWLARLFEVLYFAALNPSYRLVL